MTLGDGQRAPSKKESTAVALTTDEHNKILKIWDEKVFYIVSNELAWRGREGPKYSIFSKKWTTKAISQVELCITKFLPKRVKVV